MKVKKNKKNPVWHIVGMQKKCILVGVEEYKSKPWRNEDTDYIVIIIWYQQDIW